MIHTTKDPVRKPHRKWTRDFRPGTEVLPSEKIVTRRVSPKDQPTLVGTRPDVFENPRVRPDRIPVDVPDPRVPSTPTGVQTSP